MVYVKTGGINIHCCLGKDNWCPTFGLNVLSGSTASSICETKSAVEIDSFVEAIARFIGKMDFQARNAFCWTP